MTSLLKFQSYLNDIKLLLSSQITFRHMVRPADNMMVALAKQGLGRVFPLVACIV